MTAFRTSIEFDGIDVALKTAHNGIRQSHEDFRSQILRDMSEMDKALRMYTAQASEEYRGLQDCVWGISKKQIGAAVEQESKARVLTDRTM